MNYKAIILYFLLFVSIIGCIHKRNISEQNTDIEHKKINYKQLALEKYGDNVIFIFSPEKDDVLCKKAISKSNINPNTLLEFFVFNLNEQKIVCEDKISSAKIEWKNNYQLLITKQRGYIETPNDSGKWLYIYDLKTRKKLTPKDKDINQIQ